MSIEHGPEKAKTLESEPVAPKKLRILASVTDKTGLADFVRGLREYFEVEVLSTGGTAKHLRDNGIPVTEVSDYTGSPEVMGGRVKTLHPRVHGGILARETPSDQADLEKLGGENIDMVVVNLYEFEETVAKLGSTDAEVIESIDVGGPTMIRAAAKNNKKVTVVCDPTDYPKILAELKERKGTLALETRRALAAKVFTKTAAYDLAIARYMSGGDTDGFVGTKVRALRYGENPPWPADVFETNDNHPLAVSKFTQEAGADPSFINMTDLDRSRITITHIAAAFEKEGKVPFIAMAVKHGNACGAAIGATPEEALKKMIEGDPMAIFGGVVTVNFPINEHLAGILRRHKMNPEDENSKRLLDGVIAPSFDAGADKVLERKGKESKCRILTNPALATLSKKYLDSKKIRPVEGGFLRQQGEPFVLDMEDPRMEKTGEMTDQQKQDSLLAWAIGSTSNSNTVTLVKNGILIGNGVGQQSRVGVAKLALTKAQESGHDPQGAAAYSDSFFPEPDGPAVLAEAGIKAIFASSGGLKIKLIQETCAKSGVALWQLPDKVCRGFFAH